MSDRPWWKRPPKPTESDVVLERKAFLEATGQDAHDLEIGRKALRMGVRGQPRSKIFSFKMKVPRKKR